jgi:gamma-glutamyl-gamma-aminobutyraldehyde dehydrogenase
MVESSPSRSKDHWLDLAGRLSFPTWAWIGGRRDDGADDRLEIVSPRDRSILTSLPPSDAEGVDRAVAAARVAFDDGRWSRSAPAERRRVLSKLASLLERDGPSTSASPLSTPDTATSRGPSKPSPFSPMPSTSTSVRWFPSETKH